MGLTSQEDVWQEKYSLWFLVIKLILLDGIKTLNHVNLHTQ